MQAHPISLQLEANTFSYNDDFASVVQFIRANPKLNAKYLDAKFKENNEDNETRRLEKLQHNEKIIELENAMNAGDLQAQIYFDPECELYLLYLLKEKRINIDEFLNVYLYLSIFKNFSTKLTFKDADKDLKAIENIELVDFNHPEIQKIFTRKLHQFRNYISPETKEKIKSLNPLQRVVYVVKVRAGDIDKFDKSQFTMLGEVAYLTPLTSEDVKAAQFRPESATHNNEEGFVSPLMAAPVKDETSNDEMETMAHKQYWYCIPSIHLIQMLSHDINPNSTIQFAPIYGNVNPITLFRMHQKGYHPISLYSEHVRDNPTLIHRVKMGPVAALLHDVYHAYTARALTSKQYAFIFEYLIPQLNTILTLEKNDLDINFSLTGLANVIDLNVFEHHTIRSKGSDDFYAALNKILGIREAKVYETTLPNFQDRLRLIEILYKDREAIHKKYGVDIEAILQNNFFNDASPKALKYCEELKVPTTDLYKPQSFIIKGKKILALLKKAENNQTTVVEEYEKYQKEKGLRKHHEFLKLPTVDEPTSPTDAAPNPNKHST